MDFRTDKLLHGGDYNPEQWLKRPDILEKDVEMLKKSGCNVVSLGMFSWSTLEAINPNIPAVSTLILFILFPFFFLSYFP